MAVTFLFASFVQNIPFTFADDSEHSSLSETHFVTIHDGDNKLTVKTHAVTVSEAITRAGFTVEDTDKVEPARTDFIDSDNFHINIYRSHPVVVKDGAIKKYLLTSSFDPKTVAEDAGFSIYDGDEVTLLSDTSFLETGGALTYIIQRNGGETVTIEEDLPFDEETQEDPELSAGETKILQDGELGKKVTKYRVNFVDGEETSRELISEEIVKEPVKKIIAVGTKSASTTARNEYYTSRPDWQTCESWARAAGVSEADMDAALTLIYHESGCRANATNASSGAYGIPQALPGSKMASAGADWETNPVTQIRWMISYVTTRYGGWKEALDFWWCTGTCRGIEKKGHWY